MIKEKLVLTIYYDYLHDDNKSNFITDNNTDDDYDYSLCITKLLREHFEKVNPDLRFIDIAISPTNEMEK